MKSNLYIVASPLQLISAFEAIHLNKDDDNQLIVFFSNNENNNNILKRNLNTVPGNTKVITVDYSGPQTLVKKIRLLKKMSKEKFSKLYLGTIEEFSMKLYACNLSYITFYSLDDGTSTIHFNNMLEGSNNEIKVISNKSIKSCSKFILLKFFLLKTRKKAVVNWFTMFDFKPKNNGVHLMHHFEFLKELYNIKSNSIRQDIFIIGSNLVNQNILANPNDYQILLEKELENISNRTIYYVPHRFEDVGHLESFFEKYSIRLLRFDNIIEISLLETHQYPERIISFYSTALFSLSKLFTDTEITFIPIPKDKITPQFQPRIESVQDFYKAYFK